MNIRNAFKELTADRLVFFTILVSALGYFVDVFDLILFSVVRVASLKDLGVAEEDLLGMGVQVINAQMAGMLIGGIVWGVIGDKFGRLSVLFASIFLYSIANIANGFITSTEQYAVLRFIGGFGLAGELGAGVTLASELLPKNIRGLGTSFISFIGFMGGAAAALVGGMIEWRHAYLVGGVLGFILLAMRLGVCESGMYKKVSAEGQGASRGDFLLFFKNTAMFLKYLRVILIGAPIWAVIGIFITFTHEFAKDFGMDVLPTGSQAVFYFYAGGALGGFLIGLLSQRMQSRKKSIIAYLLIVLATLLLFVLTRAHSLALYYFICSLFGFSTGYWAMFIQVGAEQFGTNIRATAATTVPNFVRGLTIPMTIAFHGLIPAMGVTMSGFIVIGGAIVLAMLALWKTEETFHKDLDYIER